MGRKTPAAAVQIFLPLLIIKPAALAAGDDGEAFIERAVKDRALRVAARLTHKSRNIIAYSRCVHAFAFWSAEGWIARFCWPISSGRAMRFIRFTWEPVLNGKKSSWPG